MTLHGSVTLEHLVENEDGTYSPKDPQSIRFRLQDEGIFGGVSLVLGDQIIRIHSGMSTTNGALELLDAELRPREE
ncbi:hypothetical protein [uncultured Deinococcus sp.]|uniref:hypothetical protein n=1 Tax=uncultured Deinococcus sp. TaxID=158789 RepID=UPI0025F68A73|nr:hypothetical protein [uncultured Deinococcus sp.]